MEAKTDIIANQDDPDDPAAQAVPRREAFSLADFPVHDLGPWPESLSLRRADLYGDDER
jgi:hypothetical protein